MGRNRRSSSVKLNSSGYKTLAERKERRADSHKVAEVRREANRQKQQVLSYIHQSKERKLAASFLHGAEGIAKQRKMKEEAQVAASG